jgi:hypothetical protein
MGTLHKIELNIARGYESNTEGCKMSTIKQLQVCKNEFV